MFLNYLRKLNWWSYANEITIAFNWSAKLLTISLSYGHPTAQIWTLLTTGFGDLYSSMSTRHESTKLMNSSSDWLTSGVVCSRALATLPSMSRESVCRRVFAQKEDISNICCRQFRQLKETVNRHFIDSVFKMFSVSERMWFLCLFHQVVQKHYSGKVGI